MRTATLFLAVLLGLGCAKSPSDTLGPAPTSQFAEASLTLGPAPDPTKPQERPGLLSCTVGLIPAYKYQDTAELEVWIFPRSVGPQLTMDCDFANPALQGHRAQVLNQSFTGEGVLLHFDARWPGGPSGQIVGLDINRKGRHIARVYGLVQGP